MIMEEPKYCTYCEARACMCDEINDRVDEEALCSQTE